MLDVFDVADILKYALSDAARAGSVISGFKKCEIWNAESKGRKFESLNYLRFFDDSSRNNNLQRPAETFEGLLRSFTSTERSLLRESDIEESGTIRIDTKARAHLTVVEVLEALKKG